MSGHYIYTDDGGILLGEDGAPMLTENYVAPVELDFVTPFFINNPFAVSAVLIPPDAGKAMEILAIFDSPYSLSNPAGVGFETAAPACTCMTADVEDVDDTFSIYISGCEYYIKENHPDGTGVSTLILSKDPIE
jgi:hypothetical protein